MGIYEMKKPKAVNPVSVTMVLVAALLIYTGWVVIPVWWPLFREGGIMQSICNDSYREYDDEKLMAKLLRESARTGLRHSNENFEFKRIPWSPEESREFSGPSGALYALRGKECRLSFSYLGTIKWPLIGKEQSLTWNKTVTTDLKTVTW
jgi:hypothetical protein